MPHVLAIVCVLGLPFEVQEPGEGAERDSVRDALVMALDDLDDARLRTTLTVRTFAPQAVDAPDHEAAKVVQESVLRITHWDTRTRIDAFDGADPSKIAEQPRSTCAWNGGEWQEAGRDADGEFLQIHAGIRLTFETDGLGLMNRSCFPTFSNGSLTDVLKRGRPLDHSFDQEQAVHTLRLALNDKGTTIMEIRWSDADGLRLHSVAQDVFGDAEDARYAGQRIMRTEWKALSWQRFNDAWLPSRAERSFDLLGGSALEMSGKGPTRGRSVFERVDIEQLHEDPDIFTLPRKVGLDTGLLDRHVAIPRDLQPIDDVSSQRIAVIVGASRTALPVD